GPGCPLLTVQEAPRPTCCPGPSPTMEDGAGDPTAPREFPYYPLDLYDSEDRLPLFPEGNPRGGGLGAQGDQEEEDELVRLYGLKDAQELGGEAGDESSPRAEVSGFAPYTLRRRGPAREQWGWRPGGEAAGPGDPGFGAWGPAGRRPDWRDTYGHPLGRAGEEHECYVIPEEEGEEEPRAFCVTCRALLRGPEGASEEHRGHEVAPLSQALESAKDETHKNMCKLERQIIEMENFASHLEEVFITVEENFGRQEQNFEAHYNEVLETLAQRYEEKMRALGAQKREKLGALYGQLVSCGQSLETCKELMETIEDMCHEEKEDFLKVSAAPRPAPRPAPVDSRAGRLGDFLSAKADLALSEQPQLEDQALDLSEVERLLGAIHAVPGGPARPGRSPSLAAGPGQGGRPLAAAGGRPRPCATPRPVQGSSPSPGWGRPGPRLPQARQARVGPARRGGAAAPPRRPPRPGARPAASPARPGPQSIPFCSLPAPSAPVISPQAPDSATGSSVRVCWRLCPGDTVESHMLCCRPVRHGPPGPEQAELTWTVKETYCSVTGLAPNTQYEFWVTAWNRAGPSPASKRVVYTTAPSPPVIRSEELRSCEEAALIAWEPGDPRPVDSYTVELTPVETAGAVGVTECVPGAGRRGQMGTRSLRGRGPETGPPAVRSIVGIPACEALVQLQPRQSYTVCVRALNAAGASARSQPATVHTTGSHFRLNPHTCHPWLSVSEDGLTVVRERRPPAREPSPSSARFTRCAAVLGALPPVRGRHYWEVEADERLDYTVGVAAADAPRQDDLGASALTWCLRHSLAAAGHKYEFLHNKATPDIRVTVPPRRIGVLLDYDNAKLSFFNADICQHLYTFSCQLPQFVHPCFSLEKPGWLKIHNGIPTPEHVAFY
ncbi:Fibronectin type III and SPRY domain-containing protein 2, partial [Galemys pyrenaicus]